MYPVVHIGEPVVGDENDERVAGEVFRDGLLAMTTTEALTYIGCLGALGVILWLLERDPGMLIAAALTALILNTANRRPER